MNVNTKQEYKDNNIYIFLIYIIYIYIYKYITASTHTPKK